MPATDLPQHLHAARLAEAPGRGRPAEPVEWDQDREDAAIADLVRRYAPLVTSICRRRLGAGDDADDAAQATFIALIRHRDAIRDPTRLPAWLHRTALRACGRLRRASQRRQRHEHGAAREALVVHADAGADWSQARPLLDDALASLSERDRAALLQHLVDQVPQQELARQQGISREALKKRLQRSLASLEAWYRQRGIAVPIAAVMAGAAEEIAHGTSGTVGCLHAALHPSAASAVAAQLAHGLGSGVAAATGAGAALMGASLITLGTLVIGHHPFAKLLDDGRTGGPAFATIYLMFATLAAAILLVAAEEAAMWWRTKEVHWAPYLMLGISTMLTAVTSLRACTIHALGSSMGGGLGPPPDAMEGVVAIIGYPLAAACWLCERTRNRKPVPAVMRHLRGAIVAVVFVQAWITFSAIPAN